MIIFELFALLFSVEDFKRFLNDDSGGVVLPFGDKIYNDEEWLEYKRLEIDESVKSINPNDLPNDFCDEASRLVDEFHRKTVNEEVEWMLYFDYMTGEVIYCWKGEEGNAIGDYENCNVSGKNIASIHNHPKNYYSFPSPENFDILENDFEDYEIITSVSSFWVIKFKGAVNHDVRVDFQDFLKNKYDEMILNIILNGSKDVNVIIEDEISNYLLYGLI